MSIAVILLVAALAVCLLSAVQRERVPSWIWGMLIIMWALLQEVQIGR